MIEFFKCKEDVPHTFTKGNVYQVVKRYERFAILDDDGDVCELNTPDDYEWFNGKFKKVSITVQEGK